MLLSKIDEYGKLGWLTVLLLGFWLAWPVGLMLLAYLAGSGRLRLWRQEMRAPGTWFNLGSGGGAGRGPWRGCGAATSGNAAFDEYREATLRGLEEEEQEFRAFLDRLRKARDKAEFDAFMAERHQRGAEMTHPDAG